MRSAFEVQVTRDMILLALGILVVSLVFIAYYHFATPWATSSQERTEPADLKSRDDAGQLRLQPNVALIPDTADLKTNKAAPNRLKANMDEQEEDAVTPKAAPTLNATGLAVPEFSLSGHEDEPNATVKTSQNPVNQTKPAAAARSATSLMPPPSVRPSALRPLPKGNGSLMPPPSAASALRVPPGRTANGSAANGNGLIPASTSTLPPGSRPRKKVILPPGHSPLDWAHLTRNPPTSAFLRGEGIPPRMLKVSPTQLKHYHGRKGRDAWGTYQGKVYNMTPYKDFHPGGVGELMRGAGKPGEAERLFNEIHPWVNWDGMLMECLVGVLVSEGEGDGERGTSLQMDLDEMD